MLAACTGSELPTSSAVAPVASPTSAGTPAAADPLLASPTSPPPTQETGATPTAQTAPSRLPRYTLTAVFNYSQHYLAVDEQIEYTNNSSDTLTELLLMVDALYYPGVFSLNGIQWGDGPPAEGVAQETGRLRLPLSVPLAPGETLAFALTYELRLPSPQPSAETRPVPFGYTARQANLVDWYPFIPPYRSGEGWVAHPAGYFGEHLVYEVADFEVNIRLTDSAPALTIAASAPAQEDGEWRRYQHLNARSFAWSVSPDYVVSSASVGPVTVLSYAFPVHAQAGEAALQTTAQALALYNDLYAPYPRTTLSVVEADFLDGMEYDGLYFLSNGFYNLYQGRPGDYLVAIAAHETAHQWFYALVGNDQAEEPWLDEALCTYSERLYYERYDQGALEWWWAYRVNYYEPGGAVDGSIYNPQGYRPYRDAVYLNGALFLEDLRKRIGDEAFFAFLGDYVKSYSGQIARGEDFFALLRQHSQQDITDLLKQYFSVN